MVDGEGAGSGGSNAVNTTASVSVNTTASTDANTTASINFIPASADIAELLYYGKTFLSEAGIENATREAQILLGAAAGFDCAMLIARSREIPSSKAKNKFYEYINRRARKEPLQYIIGEWEFMGLPFIVNRDALIPRPDTECLVECIIDKLGKLGDCPSPQILDMCTGSGCVAISLAVFLHNSQIVASDISGRALRLAEENAKLNNVSERIVFIEGDLFKPVEALSHATGFDVICANPPYIAGDELRALPEDIRMYEPEIALNGGAGGLDFYIKIAEGAGKWLHRGGFLAVETGAGQSVQVERIFKQSGFAKTWAERDANGHIRVVFASGWGIG